MQVVDLVIAFILSAITALVVTPFIKKLAIKLKCIDMPDNNRKKHERTTASMGGLAIFIGAAVGFIYLQPENPQITAIIIGAIIMLITGLLDDIIGLKPIYKLAGQTSAALVVALSGLVIEKLTIPFFGTVYLEGIGIIITIFWIVGASNAINLIDGLDGLAAGVSGIALSSILVLAIMDYRIVVISLCVILIGSCVGFLYHNFYPAKIFMGDTGALFLGYSIAIISMLGLFKNVALFSFIIPIIVIALPVFDTILSIIRRIIKRESIATADHEHIHYRLMKMGYSHKASVFILYGFSVFFGILAITFNSGALLTSAITTVILIIGMQLIVEIAGIAKGGKQPILDSIRKITGLEKVKRNG